MKPRQVLISTGARLHYGLLSHGATGRQFGGVGAMITAPGFQLRATRADTESVCGDERCGERVLRFAAACRAAVPPGQRPPPIRWEILDSAPAHAGLGSGTQLGLAVASAAALLAGERDVQISELARRSGRGQRSAIGLYGFAQGGLLVEGGKVDENSISPLVARAALPEEWRFVLVRPRDAEGLFGAEERQGFARLPKMPAATTERLCRLALLNLLPAALERRFDEFAEALHEFGLNVGEYFSPVQGGVFADPRMRELVPRLRARGIRGIGQSSWGPTLFVACPDEEAAQSLAAELRSDGACSTCDLTVASPRNTGATVVMID